MKFTKFITVIPLLLLILSISPYSSWSVDYEPTILILYPDTLRADPQIREEIEKQDTEIIQSRSRRIQELESTREKMRDRPKNIQMILDKEIEFAEELDFYATIPATSEQYLLYRFFQRFENLMIYAIHEKSGGDTEKMRELAEDHEMRYVLAFPLVESVMYKGNYRSDIRVWLYDTYNEKLVLNRLYTGNDKNPGFEFTCEEGTVKCTISNALSQAYSDIIEIVALNNPTLIRERDLAAERTQVLMTEYYTREPDSSIPQIISENSDIQTDGYYQGFLDDSGTKLIAFFLRESEADSFDKLNNSDDNNINIQTTGNLNDLSLDAVPGLYAYKVLGVKHKGRWYLEKNGVTYFSADNLESGRKEYFNYLQSQGFFKDNTAEFSPDFWETHLFSKVEDVTKRPDFEKYEHLKDDARRNTPYVGMYNIVARALRQQKSEEYDRFEAELTEEMMQPLLDKLVSEQPDRFQTYSKLRDNFIYIYPEDKSLILSPLLVVDDQARRRIQYFVLFPDDGAVYEWIYLESTYIEDYKGYFGSKIINQLSPIVEWNFGYDTLEEPTFWNSYVLEKDNGEYKYLRPIK